MHALFNPKVYFNVLNVNFTLTAFYELLKSTSTISAFSLCMMLGMHFDNVIVLLNSVAVAYIYLATSRLTITCLYVYTLHAYMCILQSLKFISDKN